MARRIEPVRSEAQGEPMPAHLRDDWDNREWWDETAEPPAWVKTDTDRLTWLRIEAWYKISQARLEYLQGLKVKPSDVHMTEWLHAHGISWRDRDSEKVSSIGH